MKNSKECSLCGSGSLSELFVVRDILAQELLRKVSSKDDRDFLSKITNRLVTCNNCGFIFLNPRLDEDSLERLYNLWYRFGYQQIFEDERVIKGRKKEFKEYHFITLKKYCVEPGKLLDVGCGTGLFLDVCRNNGWDVEGIEFNRDAFLYAKETLGLKVFNGEFLSFNSSFQRYDAITMFDFLEHVDDPTSNIRFAYNLLKPEGFIFIRVPNVDGLQAKILKGKWYGVISNHLFYFNDKTIETLLKKSGFEPLEIKATNYTRFHSIILRHFEYIRSKLKGNIISKGRDPIQETSILSHNSTRQISPIQRFRITEYFFGILMELIDFVGGMINQGNNLTIIAKKR